jgi:hypothetical protein
MERGISSWPWFERHVCDVRSLGERVWALSAPLYSGLRARGRLWCVRCRAMALWGWPLTLNIKVAKPGSITHTVYYYAQVPLAACRPGTSSGKLVCIYDLQMWKQVGGTTESLEASVNYYYYYYSWPWSCSNECRLWYYVWNVSVEKQLK